MEINRNSSIAQKILNVLKLEKKEISAIYFYAILNGGLQLLLPIGIQSIINFVLGGAFSTSLYILIVFVVLTVFLSGFVQVKQMKIIEKIQQKIFVRYAFTYANHIPKIDLKKSDYYYLPELTNRFFDTMTMQKGISKILLDIPTALLQILIGVILLSFYHPVFIFFGIFLLLMLAIILYFTGNKGLSTSLKTSSYKFAVAGWLQEIARSVKSFKLSKFNFFHIHKTDYYVNQYLNLKTEHFKVLKFQYWTIIVFKVLVTAIMLIVGSVLLVNQDINIGQFIAAEIVIILVINSVEKLIVTLDKVYDILTSVEKLGTLIEQPLEEEGNIKLDEKKEGLKINIDNLSFSYNKDVKVLQNISLEIKPGERIGLIGLTNSGKTTLLRLLTGIYNDFSGSILINNLPINSLVHNSFHSQIGVLFTHQEIFYGTLEENITMGNKQITSSTVSNLINQLGLESILIDLPDGLEEKLDPMGKKLSSTFKNKILLLRALIGNPRLILMYDDPWNYFEKSIQEKINLYFNKLKTESTLIVASNDIEFLKSCDKIIVLDNGDLKAYDTFQHIKDLNQYL